MWIKTTIDFYGRYLQFINFKLQWNDGVYVKTNNHMLLC